MKLKELKKLKNKKRSPACTESDFKSNACGVLRQTINFVWPLYKFIFDEKCICYKSIL